MTVDSIGAGLTTLRKVVYGLAFGLVVVSAGMTALAVHVLSRQHAADRLNEQRRQAVCAILANIPGRVPREISDARRTFARPGHPGDCQPIRQVKAKPTPTPHAAGPALVVPSGGGASRPPTAPRPSTHPTHTAKPTQTPTPSPSATMASPSPTCYVGAEVDGHAVCVHGVEGHDRDRPADPARVPALFPQPPCRVLVAEPPDWLFLPLPMAHG